MATFQHPVTGVLVNEIEVRQGPISDKERETARLLLAEGHARWLVAAMLGRFPLAFTGTGARPTDRRRRIGGHLTTRDAARDPRQISMTDVWTGVFDDLFGPGSGASD
jgi:hypothetical protein